jgi:hypothetical protein
VTFPVAELSLGGPAVCSLDDSDAIWCQGRSSFQVDPVHRLSAGGPAVCASQETRHAWMDATVRARVRGTLKQIHVWKANNEDAAFVRITPHPFVGRTMVSHGRIRVDWQTNALYVMAVESRVFPSRTVAIISRFFQGAWSTPVDMPIDIVNVPSIAMSDRTIRTGPQFAFDVGAASPCVWPQDDVRILYTVKAADGYLAVRGAYCDRALTRASTPAVTGLTTTIFKSRASTLRTACVG